MPWNKNHWEFECSKNCKPHPSFWKTIVTSPQWAAWGKDISKRFLSGSVKHGWRKPIKNVWDVDECRECNWISPEHFQAFLNFCKILPAKKNKR